MGLFVDTIGTTTPLTGFDEIGITYLVATNAGWLPFLADESIKFVHYPANWVRRQFGLDQDIPFFSYGVLYFSSTLSAAHSLWILEVVF